MPFLSYAFGQHLIFSYVYENVPALFAALPAMLLFFSFGGLKIIQLLLCTCPYFDKIQLCFLCSCFYSFRSFAIFTDIIIIIYYILIIIPDILLILFVYIHRKTACFL